MSAELSLGSNLARHSCHFRCKGVKLIDHRIDGVFELKNLSFDVDRDLSGEITARDCRRHFGDIADLGGEVACHGIHGVSQVLPRAGHTRHGGLSSELAVSSYFARDAGDFTGKSIQLVDHGIDGFLQLQNLAAHIDCDLLRKIAACDGGGDFGDIAHLGRQIAGHEIDVVGQILPGSGDTGNLRLTAELSFGSHFSRDPCDFRGEGIELVNHRIDGILEFEDFAANIDGDFARQVATGDRSGDLGDVANLVSKISAHRIDGIGEVFPGTGDAGYKGLPTELAVGADFASDARDFGGE